MPTEHGERQLKLATSPAQTLAELYRTLLDQPLEADEWDLYETSVTEARGEDTVRMMARDLRVAKGRDFYRRFFCGNTATGKSTEITRLLKDLDGAYIGVRVDLRTWLNPSNVEAHEIVLAIIFATTSKMIDLKKDLQLEAEPSAELVKQIVKWTSDTEYVTTTTNALATSAGFETAKLLGIQFRGSAKTNYSMSEVTRDHQRKRFSELLNLANLYLNECYEVVRNTAGQPELLIVIEELDKLPLSLDSVNSILGNDALFKGLNAHLICNMPALARFPGELPIPHQTIYDVSVYRPDHGPDERGRAATRNVLLKRASETLFEQPAEGPGPIERLVVASGGNFRTLFRMVERAGNLCYLRTDSEQGPINNDDVTRAINAMREEYRSRLGQNGLNQAEVTSEAQIDKLMAIYNQEPGHDLRDPVLNSLMLAGAVQVSNGTIRRTVHPLVVDTLAAWGKLQGPIEAVPGGSI